MVEDQLHLCMSDLQTRDAPAFIATFCDRCRQPICPRSKWSKDKFGSRVATQEERLFNPLRADPNSSKYAGMPDFKDMLTEAIRQEIVDRRNDWEVPDVTVSDKPYLISSTQPRPAPEPSSPSSMFMQYDEPEEPVDVPEPEPEPEQVPQEAPQMPPKAPEGEPAAVAPPVKVGAAQVKSGNLPRQSGGIMLGGGPVSTPQVAIDPWAAPVSATPKAQVVKPGAKIKLEG